MNKGEYNKGETIKALQEKGSGYTDLGDNNIGIQLSGKNVKDIKLAIHFYDNTDDIDITGFNFSNYKDNENKGILLANHLNKKSRFIKFYIDTEDGDLTASTEETIPPEIADKGGYVLHLIFRTIKLIDDNYTLIK